MTTTQFAKALKAGPYTWPGFYPTFFLTSDGAALCHVCAKAQGRAICDSIRHKSNDGWRVVGQDVNWEDSSLYCDHCSKQIPSAYGDDENVKLEFDAQAS